MSFNYEPASEPTAAGGAMAHAAEARVTDSVQISRFYEYPVLKCGWGSGWRGDGARGRSAGDDAPDEWQSILRHRGRQRQGLALQISEGNVTMFAPHKA